MIKVGIIGFGRIGRVHLDTIRKIDGVEVAKVADAFIDHMKDSLAEYHVESYTNDYLDIINDESIDAVLVCSPTNTHAQIAIEAAKAGKHIFCEKPIDFDLGRVRDVINEVEKANVVFQVGFNRRFDHNFAKIKEHIKDGKIGDVHIIKITSRDPEAPPLSYVESSGGIFVDMTIHDFDMARFLAGCEPVEIYAVGDTLINEDIKQYDDIDTAVVTIVFENRAIAIIDNSREAAYGYDQRVEVFGSKGMVSAANDTQTAVTAYTKEGVASDKPLYFFLERYQQAFESELKAFFKAVNKDTQSEVSAKDGYVPILMGLAAKKSLQDKRPIRLAEIE